MTDIERRLSIAMHGAIDGEEAAPEELIISVKRRHRRHLARLSGAAAMAVAVVVVAVVALTGKIAASDSHPLTNAAASRPKLASALTGLPMPAGKNFELLVTTTYGAGWYSTATHKATPIGGLPRVLSGYQFDRVNGGWAAFPVSYSAPCDVTVCAGPPTTFYFITEGSLTATRIGDAYEGDGVGKGSQARTIWLVNYPKITSRLSEPSYAQLVTAAGHALGPRYRLPANYLIQAGAGRYLLLNLDANNYVKSELWDPRTNRVVASFDNVVAQGPEQVVWSRACQRCQLQITNVSTGKTLSTPIPGAQLQNLNATMSDDGRLLAVQLPSGEIAVFDTVTRSLTRVPGTALNPAEFEYFGWQNGGHRLIIAAGPNSAVGPGQLAYWQPADAHLYVATIRSPSEMEDIETGSV
jgi:hypothetical protein